MGMRASAGRVVPALLAVGLLLSLAACRPAAGTSVQPSGQRATGNGAMAFAEAERDPLAVTTSRDGYSVPLPADFPDDVFLPDHAVVDTAMDMAGMKMVNLTADALPDDLVLVVQASMQAQGWTRDMGMQAVEDSATLVYSKDARQAVYQMIRDETGRTRIAIRTGAQG